ncbi:MAG TPA: DUF4258 domain-containing protein [Thermodesulfovibrionales bacterium]|nr:DUF4258 domain-containing protein [Thermodesulfovibrionales bacterium]
MVTKVKEFIKAGNYRMTFHAEIERDADRISMGEMEEAFGGGKSELIEDYPEDLRGHSFLLLGFTVNEQPIHAVCSFHENILVIITVYRPDPDLWMDWRIRRQKP